jgi:signal transduction histidine kinase
MLPVLAACAQLARRGSGAGAVILATVICVTNAFIFVPATYADPPVIHVLFMLPALIYALFVVPWSGFIGAAAQTLTLGVALATAGQSGTVVGTFVIIALLDLLVIAVPLVIAAQLFRRALAGQAALATQLDSQVRARTQELHRVMRLREQDITAAVHDINNRMLVVQAEVEMLIVRARAGAADDAALDVAEQRTEDAISQLNYLVEDLRTAAQLEHAALQIQPAPLDLGALAAAVADQLSLQAAMSGCRIEISLALALPAVSGDRRQIERVLANLLGNAIKYSQQVAAERRVVRLALSAEAGGVMVQVDDQGPGLDAESLRRLGQPFTRLASARGTAGMGVGLYISKGIVELHGGRLSFSSRGPGAGVTVQLWLPAGRAGLGGAGSA